MQSYGGANQGIGQCIRSAAYIGIVPCGSIEQVGSGAADDAVVPRAAGERISKVGTDDSGKVAKTVCYPACRRARCQINRRGRCRIRKADRIRTATAVDRVGTCRGIDKIVAGTADDAVAAAGAGNHVAVIGSDDVVEMAERIIAPAGCRPRRQIHNDPCGRVDEANRIRAAAAAIQRIVARANNEQIVA